MCYDPLRFIQWFNDLVSAIVSMKVFHSREYQSPRVVTFLTPLAVFFAARKSFKALAPPRVPIDRQLKVPVSANRPPTPGLPILVPGSASVVGFQAHLTSRLSRVSEEVVRTDSSDFASLESVEGRAPATVRL